MLLLVTAVTYMLPPTPAQYGGVYADMDVMCLRPIDTWNANHNHDAAVLLGLENYQAERTPHSLHVNNWAIASMPGHPLLGQFPAVVARQMQRHYLEAARNHQQVTASLYEQGILQRTGPEALTAAMYDYFDDIGVDISNVTEADLGGKQGFKAGGVQIASVDTLSSGWDVAAARQSRKDYNCQDVAADRPEALVCHMFWGSWRSNWQFGQHKTYDNC